MCRDGLQGRRCGAWSAPHHCALQPPVPALQLRMWQQLLEAKDLLEENRVDFDEPLKALLCVSKGCGSISVPS